MDQVVIRPCEPADAEAVERLRVAGWQTAYRGIIPDAFLDALTVDVERRRRIMTERAVDVLESVATVAGDIVGWVAGGPCRDEDRPGPDQGEIFACYVHPSWWGGGVGQRLLTHAIAGLAEAGLRDLSLWVLAANHRARRFYEAGGFHPDGKGKLVNLGAPVAEVRYLRIG